MKLNLLIFALIAGLAYAMTLYFDSQGAPPNAQKVTTVPNTPFEVYSPPKDTPDFSFTDTKGINHDLKDFEGRIVLLNFWASWCAPCIKEFPVLLELAAKYPDQLTLIGLSSDLTQEAMIKFLNRYELQAYDNVFFALDENQKVTKGLFGTHMLPETYLISPERKTYIKIIGADWLSADLETEIEKLIQ